MGGPAETSRPWKREYSHLSSLVSTCAPSQVNQRAPPMWRMRLRYHLGPWVNATVDPRFSVGVMYFQCSIARPALHDRCEMPAAALRAPLAATTPRATDRGARIVARIWST